EGTYSEDSGGKENGRVQEVAEREGRAPSHISRSAIGACKTKPNAGKEAYVRGSAEGPTHAGSRDLDPEEPRMALAHHELWRRDPRRVAGRLPQHCRRRRSPGRATVGHGRGPCPEMSRPR